MKTQFKIALFLIITNILIVFLFAGSIYYFLHNYSYADFYKRLETRARISAKYNFDKADINSEAYRKIRQEHLEELSEEREYLYRLYTDKGIDSIASQISLPVSFFKEIVETGKSVLQTDHTFYAGIYYQKSGLNYIVLVSAKNYYASHHLLFMRNLILVAVVLVILIIVYFSFFFSRHFFSPIRQITDKVKQISTDNIHLRIEESDNDSEISGLISTFNDLLNRLETAFETQKNFVSNASHEFGNPLTAIMGEAEVMLNKERSPEEYRQTLRSILEQTDRLNQITQTLLYLAQTGYSNKKVQFEILRTDELLLQTKEMMDKLVPENKIRMDFSLLPENPYKLKIRGNKQLLYLALTNILSNACKYSSNQQVDVCLASSDTHVLLTVHDRGIGIPNAEMAFIYDPFFRASNAHGFDGYGIGLPLSRNIVRIHSGQLEVTSKVGHGTTVQIRIPQVVVPQRG